MNPWPGRQVSIYESGKREPLAVEVDRSNGECLVFSAMAGKKYSIEATTADHKSN